MLEIEDKTVAVIVEVLVVVLDFGVVSDVVDSMPIELVNELVKVLVNEILVSFSFNLHFNSLNVKSSTAISLQINKIKLILVL
jgi:hypothetical protein